MLFKHPDLSLQILKCTVQTNVCVLKFSRVGEVALSKLCMLFMNDFFQFLWLILILRGKCILKVIYVLK